MDIKQFEAHIIEEIAKQVFEERLINVPNPNFEYCKKEKGDGAVLAFLGIDKAERCAHCGLRNECMRGDILVMERPTYHLLVMMGQRIKEKLEAKK
jgi:hypothetical protein